MQLNDSLLSALIDQWPIARLATVTPAGDPHIVPVVFCGLDGSIYSPIDGKRKQTANLARLKNIAHQPRSALLLDQYCADWQALWWVRLDTRAEFLDAPAGLDQQLRERLIKKYPQYQSSMPDRPENNVSQWIKLSPVAVTAWSQSGSDDTIRAALK